MQKLLIKDFSVQAQTEFERPVFASKAQLDLVAEKMLQAFPNVLRSEDIDLFSGKPPYGYQLTFKMFRGSADVVVTSKIVTTSFRDGKSSEALDLILKSIDAIHKIAVTRPFLTNRLMFAVHAEFESAEAYKAYMAPYSSSDRGYLSGGKVLRADLRQAKGEVRYSTEASLFYQNSLYLMADVWTSDPIENQLFEKIRNRFLEISTFEGLEIVLAQTN